MSDVRDPNVQGSFVWTIDDPQLLRKIEGTQPGERLDSEMFDVCGAKWFLRLFPNGTKKKYEGRVSLFLQLCSLPVNTTKLKLKLLLSCDETNTQYSDIKTFSEDREFGGWTGGILDTSELAQRKQLTFRANLTLITQDIYTIEAVPAGQPIIPAGLGHYSSVNDMRSSRGGQITVDDSNGYFKQSLDAEVHFNKLESIEVRLDSLTLNVMHLSQSVKQISDAVQDIRGQIGTERAQTEFRQVRASLRSIQEKLGIEQSEAQQQEALLKDYANPDVRRQLREFLLKQCQLPQYEQLLLDNGLEDLQVLSQMVDSELREIGVLKLGHRKKLLLEANKAISRPLVNKQNGRPLGDRHVEVEDDQLVVDMMNGVTPNVLTHQVQIDAPANQHSPDEDVALPEEPEAVDIAQNL